MRRAAAFVVPWVLLGCAGDDSSQPPADAGAIDATIDGPVADAAPFDDVVYPANVEAAALRPVATEPSFATLITTPRIVTVSFASMDASLRSYVESFDDTITTTPWWHAVTSEYCNPDGGACIGPGVAAGHVVLNETAAAHYAEGTSTGPGTIWGLFYDHITGGQLPAPTFDTIYVVLMPAGTTVDFFGRASCADFPSYHLGAPLAGADAGLLDPDGGVRPFFHYAIVADCGAGNGVTQVISHELIEAATDPGGASPGFRISDTVWDLVDRSANELADECAAFATTEGQFTVTRSWSNAAVRAGHFACVPLAGEIETSTVTVPESIDLAVGESATIDVTGFADVPARSWSLEVQDYLSMSEDGGAPYVGAALDDAWMHAGKTVKATITLLREPPVSPGLSDRYAPFYVVSHGAAGDKRAIAAVREK